MTNLGVNAEASDGLAATDRTYDAQVYELYGLTDKDIKIIAGS